MAAIQVLNRPSKVSLVSGFLQSLISVFRGGRIGVRVDVSQAVGQKTYSAHVVAMWSPERTELLSAQSFHFL
jgi:hypothetical protein